MVRTISVQERRERWCVVIISRAMPTARKR